jgi:hypothetical protein
MFFGFLGLGFYSFIVLLKKTHMGVWVGFGLLLGTGKFGLWAPAALVIVVDPRFVFIEVRVEPVVVPPSLLSTILLGINRVSSAHIEIPPEIPESARTGRPKIFFPMTKNILR